MATMESRMAAAEERLRQLEKEIEDLKKILEEWEGGRGPKWYQSGSIHPELDDQAIAPPG
jgi:predicted translin family RNA/ssDNA-binding protein